MKFSPKNMAWLRGYIVTTGLTFLLGVFINPGFLGMATSLILIMIVHMGAVFARTAYRALNPKPQAPTVYAPPEYPEYPPTSPMPDLPLESRHGRHFV